MPRPRHRRPRGDLPDDPNELLALIAETRGSELVLNVVFLLTEPLFRGGSWRDAEPIMRMIQAMGDAGIFSDAERFYLLAQVSEAVLPSRGREDPRFDEVEREMQAIRDAHGLAEDDDFLLPDAPAEFRALNDEWSRIADREMAKWLASLGEKEMARLLEFDRSEFEECHMEGREEIAGEL